MVNKTEVLFSLLAALSLVFLLSQLNAALTGNYAAAGGGDWYYGPQKALLQPDEACVYAGLDPVEPWHVYTNEYGTMMSLCRYGGQYAGVPLVQTIVVR